MSSLVLKSERQAQTEMLSKLISLLGLNDVNPGSVIDIVTQAAAQQQFALYYQIAQLSRIADLDALTGTDLDNKAFEYGLTRFLAAKATGLINILRAEGFVKVSTTFFAGFPAPVAGDTQIFVNDASNVLYGSSGTLIIGRGSNNEEEVNYSVAPVDNINYFTITLSSPLVNNHSTLETIILKQGVDETILAGTTVVVPATGTNNQVQFATVNDAVLLAGELEVDGVEVIAAQPGSDGNVASNAISGTSAFTAPPFPGARAFNTAKFTTGRDRETDDQLRDRIKSAVPALSRGVKQAILNAIVGLVDPVSAKRVVSASVVLPVQEAGAVFVYIDDGTGFEPTFASQGFETVKSNAAGGEQRLQTDHFPVVKAQIENNKVGPYDMSGSPLTLEIAVSSESETITFQLGDFRFPAVATAEEIVIAINNKASLVEARTSNAGQNVVITAKVDVNEDLQIVSGTANTVLLFPTDRKQTIQLYVDDVKLSKDGITAILDSQNSAPYNLLAVGSYPHTLTIVVDGKTANPQTATINLIDVNDPSAVTVTEIVNVLNRDLAGVTASGINSNTQVQLKSNTLLSSSSKLHVTGGSANNATNGLNFSTVEVVGIQGDFIFNRELGIVQLAKPLVANQTVTAGDLFTRAKLRAALSELYAPSNGQTLVISVDGGADQTVTFDGTFVAGLSAQLTANFINAQLFGAKAVVRTVGSDNFLEIRTNTYDSTGSIEIKSSSTANAVFSFTLDTVIVSGEANQAFKTSVAGPFNFPSADSLVVVIDNDIVNNTFSVTMDKTASVSAATSSSVFADSTLPNTFQVSNQIDGFFAAFLSGANTTTGSVDTVTVLGGGFVNYHFATLPVNFSNFAAGDLANFTGLSDSENNVNAVITSIGSQDVTVKNPSGVNASTQAGSALLGEKRTVSAYNNLNGQVTVSSPFSNTPSISDSFVIIPHTVQNVVDFLNNTRITSLSQQAAIEASDDNTEVQISSLSNGSDGYVQITGGSANDVLQFDTLIVRGLAGYNYWTGLIPAVHKTIYGDDSDLVSYPGVGAAGILFRILAPTVNELEIQLNVTLSEGISITSLENEIRSAVTGYVNSLGVGQEVVIEEIRAAVIGIAGVVDVSLITPVANVAVADNELARVSDANVLIG